ncbi:MAG: HdeD family acid-resistance protein [Spirochaetota bacterium]
MTRTKSSWWLVALRGLIALLFGIFALAWPAGTATALVVLIAVFVLLDGVLSLVASARARQPLWGFGVFEGVVGVVIGVLALVMPRVTAMVLAVLVGIWALVTGIIELVTAIRLWGERRSVVLLGVAGVLSTILGVAIIVSPGGGVVALTVLVGIYALLFGIAIIVYGLLMRRSL